MTGTGCGGCGEGKGLAGDHAAVNRDNGAGDEGGFFGGEPDYGLGDLLGVAHASGWRLGDHPVLYAGIFVYNAADHGGICIAGADGVDTDAVLGVFEGGDLGEA